MAYTGARNSRGQFVRKGGRSAAADKAAPRTVRKPGARAALSRKQREQIFFRELSMVCNVSSALRRSRLGGDPYERRRLDPDFRRRWDEAILESYPLLELEMLERGRFGDTRPTPKSEVEKRLREVPTAVAMQLLRYYHSRVKAAPAAAPAAPRRTARAEAAAVRRELLAALSECNRRMGGNG